MGVEIAEEFRPITPIRTVSASRTCTTAAGTKFSDVKEVKEKHQNFDEDQDYCESESACSTPKSAGNVLKSSLPLLVCPPAPRKPRPPKRKLSPPPQGYFEVPHDLESVFMVLNMSASKKIRAP